MTTVTIKQGILNLPGATLASKNAAESLLAKDFDVHHAYFRKEGYHNHLSHHILAAYDLGASPELLKAIYEKNASMQRPIMLGDEEGVLKPGDIDSTNWKKHLGNQKGYAAFVHFFKKEADALGAAAVVEKYVFSAYANEENGFMLIRLVSGAIHPIIQLGYAAEFGNDLTLIVEALAQTAIHDHDDAGIESFKFSPTEKKLPLLHVLAEIYKSPDIALTRPFEPKVFFTDRLHEAIRSPSRRGPEIARICSMWNVPDSITSPDLNRITEETIWATTLLLAGISELGQKPKLDFFLMHALTSALFLPSICKNLIKNPIDQGQLYRHWLAAVVIVLIIQGLPPIRPEVLMSYIEYPLPPNFDNIVPIPNISAVTPESAPREAINPWPLLVQSALRAPDPHTPKALRTLLFGAIHYGTKSSGEIPGAMDDKGKEIIPGITSIDGSIFVRAAGVMMDAVGWVDWAQPRGDWARL